MSVIYQYRVSVVGDKSAFMICALEQAFAAMGCTSPNPAVGAVIVMNGTVAATGKTSACGGDHAEVTAIKKAPGTLQGAEMFVSLEPCCHYGKTPPCTEAIIRAGIKRVYIPLLDPNPMVAGKGVLALKNAGVDVVIMNEFASQAVDLIRPFRKYILRKRPFIIQKLAVTLDGRTATKSGDSRWISSDCSRYIVHRLRAIADAVIIGKNTLIADNPSLNVRLEEFPDTVKCYFRETNMGIAGYDNYFLKKLLGGDAVVNRDMPLRIVIGLPDKIDSGANFFRSDDYIFFVDENTHAAMKRREDHDLIQEMEKQNKIVFIGGDTRVARVHAIQEELYTRGIMMALLEGGSAISGSFFDAGEIDQYLYFIAPKIIGCGTPAIDGNGISAMQDSVRLKDVSTVMIQEDLLYSGYREPYNFEMM